MKVKELVEKLQEFDQELEVLFSDEEGNDLNAVSEVCLENAILYDSGELEIVHPDDLEDYLEECREDGVEPNNKKIIWVF
jgi:predicted HicB family RNase H-like nuclease